MQSNTFARGVGVLLIGGVLAKAIGALYRIPLTWVLGTQGIGIYQLVYPVFALLLVLSSTGAPTAISTMIADRVHTHRFGSIRKILRLSIQCLFAVGVLFGLLLGLGAYWLSNLQGNPDTFFSYIAISFAIPLVAILSAYRGYFQGLLNMTPTAISQIIEQVFKLVFGLLLANILGVYGVQYAVLGAVSGVVLSEMVAVLFVVVYYKKCKVQFVDTMHTYTESTNVLLRELLKNATPIILCSFVLPLLQMIDSLTVVKLLGLGGIDSTQATIMWGINSGVVNSLVNLPIALTMAVAVVIAPSLRSCDGEKIKDNISMAYTTGINISLPFAVILGTLSGVIVPFLYQNSFADLQFELPLAVHLLMINAPFVLFITLMQIQNAVLQGVGRGYVPLKNMLLAGAVKIVLLIALVSNGSINIYGVVIANICFYLLAFVFNTIYLHKKIEWHYDFKQSLPCVLSSVMMGVYTVVGNMAITTSSVFVRLLLLLLIGGSVYVSTLIVSGGVKSLPKILQKLKNKVYKTPRG